MKKFLILTLISLNLVACSQNTDNKEANINVGEVEAIKYEENNSKQSENNTNNNEEVKKDNNLNFEICADLVKYEQGDKLYYQLSDNYGVNGNPGVMEFFETEKSLEKLKNFNDKLKTEFDYNELHHQPLVYNDYFENDKEFSYGGIINEEIYNEENQESTYQTKLNTLIIGKTLYNNLDNDIEDGRNFTVDDFIVDSPNKEISIILGSDYKDIYNIGDKLNLSLHEKELKFKVIGFLKNDVQKFTLQPNENLNKTVIIPFYDINYAPNDEVDELYQKIYYTQKNGGFIKLEENECIKIIEDVKNLENIYYDYLGKVEQIASEYDLLFSIPVCPVRIEN